MATMNTGLGGPAGYGENVFSTASKAAGGVDDGSVEIDVTSVFGSGGIDFFGTSYTEIYLNSNGTISFGTAFTDYQTGDLTAETTPMLAPFFADVNINDGGEIYWDIDPGAGTITMTWLDVAPYSGSGTNSFQVVLTDNGGGDFSVEYIYEDIQWSGSDGDVADVGYTDGGANDVLLDGSGDSSELLDYETNDFQNGNPSGTYAINFVDGVPSASGGIVDGTDGADTIDAAYPGDPDGNVIDGADGDADSVYGLGGDDVIESGSGADTVFGGTGNDTIDGGVGHDVIYGDNGGGQTPTAESLNWSAEGGDGTNIEAGFTQNTGLMDVTVSFDDGGSADPLLQVETSDTIYTAGGEPFDSNSSGYLFSDNDAVSTTRIDFAGAARSGLGDEVSDVEFRINDIDWGDGNHTDIVTVNAFNAAGDPVMVTITPGAGDTVVGNTITAETVGESQADAGGSALIEIAGPVSRVEIEYSNGQSGTQAVWISDVHFTTIPPVDGDDVIDGGAGRDTIHGEGGDDTIDGGGGADEIYGDNGPAIAENTISITNSSFEAEAFSDGDYQDGVSGWFKSGDVGTYDPTQGELDNAEVSGENVAYLYGNGDTLSQTTNETYQAGEYYEFTADVGDGTYDGNSDYTINIYAGATLIGTVSGTTTTDQLDTVTVSSEGFSDPALNGQSISIEFVKNSGGELLVDNVQGTAFSPTPGTGTGNDSISGGAGADTIDGQGGDDTIDGGTGIDLITGGDGDDEIYLAQGDTVTGGDGDDLFVLTDLGEAGNTGISISGGEGDETDGDTLQLNADVSYGDINFTNTGDDAGGLSGNFTMGDGTVVTFTEIENIICFTAGARILTEHGERPIETLRPGDRVVTRDNGLQPIRWLGQRTVEARGRFAPIVIDAHMLDGARRPLIVSPQHRVLFEGYQAELLFGTPEVLITASHLVDGTDIRQIDCAAVTYIHMMLDRHEVIYAEGAATESFHAGQTGLSALSNASREEMFTLFPDLRSNAGSHGPAARRCLKRHEARLLSTYAPALQMPGNTLPRVA